MSGRSQALHSAHQVRRSGDVLNSTSFCLYAAMVSGGRRPSASWARRIVSVASLKQHRAGKPAKPGWEARLRNWYARHSWSMKCAAQVAIPSSYWYSRPQMQHSYISALEESGELFILERAYGNRLINSQFFRWFLKKEAMCGVSDSFSFGLRVIVGDLWENSSSRIFGIYKGGSHMRTQFHPL